MAHSLILTAVLLTAAVPLQQHEHSVPGIQKLGTVRFTTSCNGQAQGHFLRGLALLHSFAFPSSIDAFNQALSADPKCAIAYWGLALSAWGNPFAAGTKAVPQLQRGTAAVERGKAVGAGTDREREYVLAVSRLFEDFTATDQRRRVMAYREAMALLSARYPDDAEAAIFYALSLAFSADPSDKTYADQLKAGAILEKLFRRQPNHPGLAHYIIHSYDVPTLARQALNAAERYASIAPAASHALHMPSHTFTRLGYWQESIRTNMASAASARREGSTAEELHASDYLIYAYLQTGQDRAARSLLDALPEIAGRFDPNVVGTGAPPAAAYFAIAALPARFALERGDWKQAAALEVRQTAFPFTDAITHFSRALGSARLGDITAVKTSVTALQEIREKLAQQNETYWREQVDIQAQAATAWLAFAEGRKAEALAAMRATAEREDATEKNAITPGPIVPARELLAEMLLEQNQPAEALKEFEATLKHEPNRFRTVAGAVKAAEASNNPMAARKYRAQLVKICSKGDTPGRPELAEARRR
jgi:hypothetical protein